MTSEQNKAPPREKVIERLKKLFALGQSGNQHEAELAMAKANEIMTEYQISATDVDLHEDGEVVREDVELDGGRRSTWLSALADACAKLYDAKAFYVQRSGPNLRIRYFGTPADIMAAKMTFSHLHSSWQSIVKADLRLLVDVETRSFKRSHGIGFTTAVSRRVDSLVRDRQEKVRSATGRDLVLVKGSAVQDALKSQKIGRGTSSKPADEAGFSHGLRRGHAIPLHGGIEEEKTLMIGAS